MATNISQRFVKTGDFFLLVDTDLRGGFRIVASMAERDAIPIQARKQGMIVRVIEAGLISNWELGFGKPITNAGWIEAQLGGGGDFIPIAGGPLEGEVKANEFGSINFNDTLKMETFDGNLQMTRMTPQASDDPEPRGMLTFNNGRENTVEINTEIGQMVCKTEVALSSDRRLKTDITRITGAMKIIRRMYGYRFKKVGMNRLYTGLIAQEVKQVLPESVTNTTDGNLAVFYGSLAGVFVEGFHDVDDRLKAIEKSLEKILLHLDLDEEEKVDGV